MSVDSTLPGSSSRTRGRVRKKVVPTYKLRQQQREAASSDPAVVTIQLTALEDDAADLPLADEAGEQATAAQPSAAGERKVGKWALSHRVRGWMDRLHEDEFRQKQVRHSAVPYLAACTPAVVTSIFAPPWLAWVMSWISLVALYRVAQTLDETAFSVSISRGFFAYALPVNVFLALWSWGLLMADRHALVSTTAFTHIAVVCLAVLPAVRWARDRSTRRLPLRWSYSVLALIVVVAQGMTVFRNLG